MKDFFNRLGFFKSGNKETGLPALPAPEEEITREALFPKVAHTCTFCRTRALSSTSKPELGLFWLEASAMPSGLWLIKKITEKEDFSQDLESPGTETTRTVTPYKKKPVPFSEMIETLANFEKSQITDEVPAGPMAKEIGQTYYKTALAGEGIVFERNGTPHAVYNRTIITDGDFPAEAFETAANYKPPAKTPSSSAFNLFLSPDNLSTLLYDNSKIDVLSLMEDKTYIESVVSFLKRAHNGLKKRLEQDSYQDWKFMHLGSYFTRNNDGDDDTYNICTAQPICQAHESAAQISDPHIRGQMYQMIYEYRLFAFAVIAKDALSLYSKGRGGVNKNTIEDLKRVVKKAGKDLGDCTAGIKVVQPFINAVLLSDTNKLNERVDLMLSDHMGAINNAFKDFDKKIAALSANNVAPLPKP